MAKENYMNILGNYCDDNELLASFFQKAAHHVSWELFENQEDWLHMASEGRKPKLKDYGEIDHFKGCPIFDDDVKDNMNAVNYIKHLCKQETWLIAECMTEALIANYYLEDIDLPQGVKDYYVDAYGVDSFQEIEEIWKERAEEAELEPYRYRSSKND